MCGIFGFWLRRPLVDDDIAFGRRATAMLAHRGPDGQGEWIGRKAGIFFGHRRLAILDLSDASAQPMQRNGGVIAFNGEIYNFQELRSELVGLGECFITSGDTEVLLKAWQRWGVNCLDNLDGMFAAAIYDGSKLHLFTDPFGEKPLFIAKTIDGIFFASEAQVLIDTLELVYEPSEEEVTQFLALGFIPTPGTGFPGLEWLPPATLRSYNQTLYFNQSRYWEMSHESASQLESRFTESDLDTLGEILTRLLRRRLRADVPIGLFLSSGVDSALIGALVSRELHTSLNSMTVSFADGEDETRSAMAIANHLGLPHEVIDSRLDPHWKEMPVTLASFFGIPNDNTTAISIYQMAKLAHSRMIVALSGLGGDEAFYGYNKYKFLYKWRHIYRIPYQLFFPIKMAGRFLNKTCPRWDQFERFFCGNGEGRFLAIKNREIGELIRKGRLKVPLLPDFDKRGRDLVRAARDFDLRQTLPASYAAAVDRGSMRAGLEVRTPYLSRELFDHVNNFSLATMFGGDRQKMPLRRLLARYLPDELIEGRKQGFIFPLERYLKTFGDFSAPQFDARTLQFSDLWDRRLERGCDSVVLRMMILSEFGKRNRI